MSKSKKWKVEWSFFLGTDGRRKYNEVCRRCIHDCKQSLRTMILACPHYAYAALQNQLDRRN